MNEITLPTEEQRETMANRRTSTGKVIIQFKNADGKSATTNVYNIGREAQNKAALAFTTPFVRKNWIAFYDVPESY